MFLPSLHGGGAERMFVRLASRFLNAGHDVDIVLMTTADLAYCDELDGAVRIVDLNVPRLWTSLPAFHRYLRMERPDAVLAAMPLANGIAACAARLSGTRPVVAISERNSRSLALGDVDVVRHRPLMWAIRRSYPFADFIIATSSGVADRVREIPRVSPDRVHVIHNPSWTPEIEARAVEPVDHPWFEDGGSPIILSAGRLEQQKDFATLVSAFGLLRQSRAARLVILGKGTLHNALRTQVEAAGLAAHVSFPGFSTNPFSYMARASVFALSSIHEGFGNVLVEAMACGTPVVSTNCPSGPSEILDGGRYGPLVPVGDAPALARAIQLIMDNPTKADLLKARAKEFSLDAAAEAYMRVLGLTKDDSRLARAVL